MNSLSNIKFQSFKEAEFYQPLDFDDSKSVKCFLCSHYCTIKNNNFGICKVRFNSEGKLYTITWGQAEGLAIDPIEKKPLYHFKPSTRVLSFGTPGCNFFCLNCQNNTLSQLIKKSDILSFKNKNIEPSEILQLAVNYKADGIAYTYSEPTIFFEYARDIILLSKSKEETKNLFHIFVSNGYFSKEILETIVGENLIDAINIDLKFFDDKNYKKITGGTLKPVLDSIEFLYKHKIHLEITNLVIPDLNDNDEDFQKLTNFVLNLSKDIPLHFSRFYPHYKMLTKHPTIIDRLLRAKEIAINNGLNYIYIGNTDLPDVENTYCPKCHNLLIERKRYRIFLNFELKKNDNFCPVCGYKLNIIS
ncbi:MAG: AmmeMemoRadiSam system radical SAM enzyme [Candidatus Kapabacteria bacterium]|nr:AmmeMemoRadiSam system radical SAM enzyme [Candidatus Kapabacteria bacterium]